jgi:hypothetical protein
MVYSEPVKSGAPTPVLFAAVFGPPEINETPLCLQGLETIREYEACPTSFNIKNVQVSIKVSDNDKGI